MFGPESPVLLSEGIYLKLRGASHLPFGMVSTNSVSSFIIRTYKKVGLVGKLYNKNLQESRFGRPAVKPKPQIPSCLGLLWKSEAPIYDINATLGFGV